jgi:hypothetical protein
MFVPAFCLAETRFWPGYIATSLVGRRRWRSDMEMAYDPFPHRVAIWDGGRGKVAEPFTLNGHALAVAGTGRHDLIYRVVPVEASFLKKGRNEIVVLSDTEHHGIEVLLPGPGVVVRVRK